VRDDSRSASTALVYLAFPSDLAEIIKSAENARQFRYAKIIIDKIGISF